MTLAQILGALLIAAPFVALAVITTREMGWRTCLAVFGGTALIVGVIYTGSYLLTGSWS